MELAQRGECAALIAVWDSAKQRKIVPSEAVWAALDRLHSRGKGKIPVGNLILAPKAGRALAPGIAARPRVHCHASRTRHSASLCCPEGSVDHMRF